MFKSKLKNQELSLAEFKQKKTTLKALPSRAIVELARKNESKLMAVKTFEKVAKSIFPSCYSVDLRGFGELGSTTHWAKILKIMSKYPTINWHVVSRLTSPITKSLPMMVDNRFVVGLLCTQKARFNKNTEKNLTQAVKLIEEKKNGFLFFIVPLKNNFSEIPKFIKLASKFRVSEVQITTFYEDTNEKPKTPTKAQVAQINRALGLALVQGIRVVVNNQKLSKLLDKRLYQRASIANYPEYKVNFPPSSTNKATRAKWQKTAANLEKLSQVCKNSKCFKPYHFIHITPGGDIGPCNHMMGRNLKKMGNVLEQPFDDIWNGVPYQFFRRTVLKKAEKKNQLQDKRCQWCFKYRLED